MEYSFYLLHPYSVCSLLGAGRFLHSFSLDGKRGAASSSPPGEDEFVEVVVSLGQEALLHEVRRDAHLVALTPDVHLDTVQQVINGESRIPGPEGHHRLLGRLQAVDGVFRETQVLLRPQHADHDGGVACGDGLGSGDSYQHLEDK